MSDLAIASYVKLVATMQALKERREKGADALEYVGMVLIAAFVVGTLVAAVQAAGLQAKVSEAINKILTSP